MNSKRFVRYAMGIALLGAGLYGCGGDDSTPAGGGAGAPAAPAALTAALLPGPAIHVTWKDNSTDEDSFVLERKVTGGEFSLLTSPTFNAMAHHDADVMPATMYTYRVSIVRTCAGLAPKVMVGGRSRFSAGEPVRGNQWFGESPEFGARCVEVDGLLCV